MHEKRSILGRLARFLRWSVSAVLVLFGCQVTLLAFPQILFPDCARAGTLPSLVRPASSTEQGGRLVDTNLLTTLREPEEIPLLWESVFPCHWVVAIDYVLAGCPPSTESVWKLLRHLVPDPAS